MAERDVAQHLLQGRGVRAGGHQRFLRSPELGRRNHLHRFGNLLRALKGADALANVAEAGHLREWMARAEFPARAAPPMSQPGPKINVGEFSQTAGC
jgi:hypothetical protein